MISTLQRAIDCTQKEAVDFATTVDREVRKLATCTEISAVISVQGIICSYGCMSTVHFLSSPVSLAAI